jgi:amidase
MQRRELLAQAAAAAAAGALPARAQNLVPMAAMSNTPAADFPWAEASAAELQAAMASGRTTALGLVQAYAGRIAAIDRAGPTLRSVLVLNPDAEAIAAERDAERKAGRLRGPLHGLPVLVKDNLATADRMDTTAGSPALAGAKAPRDSTVIARLRQAGAVILGKTNLSEWANFRGQKSSSGWSTLGGQALNPYALDRSPSGSSSGTGAALAANLAALGVGTETDGSIISPASVNGLVGFKPTVGLVSRHGIVPIAFSQDTAGPMCRSVADAALLLAAMAGEDPRDATTRAQAGKFDAAALARLPANALKGARLGVARQFGEGGGRELNAVFEDAVKALRSAGAVLVDVTVPNTDKYGASELEVLCFEMKASMADYLTEFAPNLPHRSLADLVAYNRAHPQALAVFGQEWFETAAAKGALTSPAYRKALAHGHRYARAEGLDRVLKQHRLDAIVAPSGGAAWLIDHVNGDSFGPSAASPAAVAGYPHLTVPMGQVRGLPVAISFMGGAWHDARLLALGLHFEQAAQARKPPGFRARTAQV